MKKIKKIISVIAVAVILVSALSIFSFAEETTAAPVIIKNEGSTKTPVFKTEEGITVFCLERDKKAPSKTGTEYFVQSLNEYNRELNKVIINFNKLNPVKNSTTIAQYAIWAITEKDITSFETLTNTFFGEEGVTYFNELLAAPVGEYNIEIREYFSDDIHQKMFSAVVTEVTTTPAPTEEPTEVPSEEPTEEPSEVPSEEPTETPTEEPSEAPTEGPTEEPTEEPTETPTEVVISEDPFIFTDKYTTPDTPEIPNTDANSNIMLVAALVVLGGASFAIISRKKKSDC